MRTIYFWLCHKKIFFSKKALQSYVHSFNGDKFYSYVKLWPLPIYILKSVVTEEVR